MCEGRGGLMDMMSWLWSQCRERGGGIVVMVGWSLW